MNKVIITLDVFNEYAEKLTERIRAAQSSGKNPMKFYVGDCLTYTFQLSNNNGWSPLTDSPNEIYEILKAVLVLCFSACGIQGTAQWSNDMNYIIVT